MSIINQKKNRRASPRNRDSWLFKSGTERPGRISETKSLLM